MKPDQKSGNFLPELNIVMFSAGKELFSGENNRNLAGNILKVKSGGETNFLSGSSCYLGGEAFQRGRYWRVSCVGGNCIFSSIHKSVDFAPFIHLKGELSIYEHSMQITVRT